MRSIELAQPETNVPNTLVSVIIPAFNASNTIDATLISARSQTHRELEILVVDDGSTDETASIAHRHAMADPRVRVVQQVNGGPSQARNHALKLVAGDVVAPLDADDLWHPEKIARQLAALDQAGSDCALVYNWFRRIDGADRVAGVSASPQIGGRVLFRHIDWNFISNGSTPLVRASVARDIGYEPGLPGGEDYLFQLRVALLYRFACVPAFLTGYRVVAGSQSSASSRMICSHMRVYSLLRSQSEDRRVHALVDRRLATLQVEMARNRLRRRKFSEAFRSGFDALTTDLGGAFSGMRGELRRIVAGNTHVVRQDRLHFAALPPDLPDGPWSTRRSQRWLRHLAQLDGEMA
jgi:glycosyltransferase involved in cell wall biosynthesis